MLERLEAPKIVDTVGEPYAFLHLHIPRSQMQTLLPATLQELIAALKAQGQPIEPWFAHHLTLSDGNFDFETCLPVSDSFVPTGRIQRGLWPAGSVARTVYSGDYAGLPEAWAELNFWIKERGYPYARHIYERYLVTPHAARNPDDYRTEMSWPLLTTAEESETA